MNERVLTRPKPMTLESVEDDEDDLDLVMRDLNDLQLSTPPAITLPVPAAGAFDFKLPLSSPNWPGPRYEELMQFDLLQFVPGNAFKQPGTPTNPKQTGRRRTSKRAPVNDVSMSKSRTQRRLNNETIKAPRVSGNRSRPPRYIQTHTSNRATGFLSLPTELRLTIYRHLCTSYKPFAAQYRCVIKCHQGRLAYEQKRFPREPTLALVNRQVGSEALSVFYRDNVFTFAGIQHRDKKINKMTEDATISKWMRPPCTRFLTTIELHFAYSSDAGSNPSKLIKYTFQKQRNGSLEPSHNLGDVRVNCVCKEAAVHAECLRPLQKQKELSLLLLVRKFIQQRADKLWDDSNVYAHCKIKGMYLLYGLDCKMARCGKATVDSIEI